MVITTSLIIPSIFGKEHYDEGYHWIHSQIKSNRQSLSNRKEIEQAVKNLKRKYYDSAMKVLKGFEKSNLKLGLLLQPISLFCNFLSELC